jgi:hypothetical protein
MPEKSAADKDLESVTAAADRLGLKGKDRTEYIHKHMTGYGYRSRRTYYEPDDDDSGGGGFFGRGRRDRDDDEDE